jgi:hypothetical protein
MENCILDTFAISFIIEWCSGYRLLSQVNNLIIGHLLLLTAGNYNTYNPKIITALYNSFYSLLSLHTCGFVTASSVWDSQAASVV